MTRVIYSPSYKTLAKVLDYNVVYINGSAPEANKTLDKFLKRGSISLHVTENILSLRHV